jgi:gas vesicle protein
MNSGKIFLGLLAGVAIGATLGIIFAPDKGSATRKKISKKRDELTEELENKFDEFVDNITEKFETVKDEAASMANKGEHKAETFVENKK